MRETSMMREAVHRPFESPKHVKIRRLDGERHGRGGQRGSAIESGPGEYSPGQEVGDRFQVKFVTQPTMWGQPPSAVRSSAARTQTLGNKQPLTLSTQSSLSTRAGVLGIGRRPDSHKEAK